MTKREIHKLLEKHKFPHRKEIMIAMYDCTRDFPYYGTTDHMEKSLLTIIWSNKRVHRGITGGRYNLSLHFLLLLEVEFPNDTLLNLIMDTRCWTSEALFQEMFKVWSSKLSKS